MSKTNIDDIEKRILKIINDRDAELKDLQIKIDSEKERQTAAKERQKAAELSGDFDGYKAAKAEYNDAADNIAFYTIRVNHINTKKDVDAEEIERLSVDLLRIQNEDHDDFLEAVGPIYDNLRDQVRDERRKFDRVNANLDRLKSYLNGSTGTTSLPPWQFIQFESFIRKYENTKGYMSQR